MSFERVVFLPLTTGFVGICLVPTIVDMTKEKTGRTKSGIDRLYTVCRMVFWVCISISMVAMLVFSAGGVQ